MRDKHVTRREIVNYFRRRHTGEHKPTCYADRRRITDAVPAYSNNSPSNREFMFQTLNRAALDRIIYRKTGNTEYLEKMRRRLRMVHKLRFGDPLGLVDTLGYDPNCLFVPYRKERSTLHHRLSEVVTANAANRLINIMARRRHQGHWTFWEDDDKPYDIDRLIIFYFANPADAVWLRLTHGDLFGDPA